MRLRLGHLSSLVLVILAVYTTPSFANCENYLDGSIKTAAPQVILCYKGICDNTTVDFVCSNMTSTQIGYADGLNILIENGGSVVFRNELKILNRGEWFCIEVSKDGCEAGWDSRHTYKFSKVPEKVERKSIEPNSDNPNSLKY
jgi:hypothetical protein